MTLTTKDSADPASLSKPTTQAPNPSSMSAQTPRSNPVCLEVGVTIRSLPTESGGAFQPIREEGRTVIVFDNGAVLRSTSNLPAGQTVILSNSSGRDVVCRIVGARNMPSVKGYVEVEFIEPVDDFWNIHEQNEPTAISSAGSVTPAEKSASVSTGSGPSFDDVAGLVSPSRAATREPRIESAKPGRDLRAKSDPLQTPAETKGSAVRSAPRTFTSESRNGKVKVEVAAAAETESGDPQSSAASSEFISGGLLASISATSSSSRGLGDGMPLRIGGAALLLAAIGGVMYFIQRNAPATPAQVAVAQQSSTAESTAAAKNKDLQPGVPGQVATAQDPLQGLVQLAGAAHAEPTASSALTPASALASSPAARDLPNAQRQDRNAQDKSANVGKTSDVASERSQTAPNLKMKSPIAPKRNLTAQGEAPAPTAEIATPEGAGGISPAELLSAVVRSANQPVPPPSPSVLTAKTTREAKLISAASATYPPAAKTANVQGTVAVLATIDSNGKVVDVKAQSGPMLLRQAALESVRKWKYSPALADGKPVSTQLIVAIDFKLH